MNRFKKIILLVLCLMPVLVKASAYNLEYRSDATKNNKAMVNINGANIRFTAWVSANLQSTSNSEYKADEYLIDNISVTNNNGNVVVAIKRSELNKIFKTNNFENVSILISVHCDYLDLKKGNKYYMFSRGVGSSGYWYETYDQNYEMRTNNVLEVYNGAGSLVGTEINELANNHYGIYVYQTDEYPSYSNGRTYNLEEFKNNSGLILAIASTGVQINIIEDEKIDMGNNNNIVTPSGEIDENGAHVKTEIKEVDMDSFYAKYSANNQLLFSWSLYDEQGNPIKIDFDTTITLDESENEEEILSAAKDLFEDIDGKVSIITFKHDGEIGGVAKIKLYLKDKFKPGEKVRLYYYDPSNKTLSLQSIGKEDEKQILEAVVDEEGYVELTFTHCSEYLITNIIENDDIKVISNNLTSNKNNISIPLIIGITLAVSLAIIGGFIFIKKKRNKNKI